MRADTATHYRRLLHIRIGIALAIALCVGGFAYAGWLKPLDLLIYDWAQRLADKQPAPDILIVTIDDGGIEQLGRWPWPRSYHARVITELQQAGARAIIFDVLFSEPDRTDPQADLALAQAIQKAGNVFLPVYISGSSAGRLRESLPIPVLAQRVAGLGHVHYESDNDGVCRSIFLREGVGRPHWLHLAAQVASYLGELDQEHLPGQRAQTGMHSDAGLVQRDYRNWLRFLGQGERYTSVSYLDLLNGAVAPELLRDKVVFIGSTATGLGDRVVTPTSSDNFILSGVELNATIYQMLRENQPIRVVSGLPYWLSSAVAALAIALAGAFLAPRSLMLLLFAGVGATTAITILMLNGRNLWYPPAGISMALLLSYLFWSLYRLQQALRYFRRELAQLAAEKSLLQRSATLEGLYAGLSFLTRVIPVKGWVVCSEAQEERRYGDISPAASDAPSLNHWLFRAGGAAIRLVVADRSYSLFIEWQEGRSWLSAAEQEVLRALVRPYIDAGPADLPRAPEAITGAIVQLNQANESFREISHFAQYSLARMADGVAITDKSGRVLFANEMFRELLGQENADPMGQIGTVLDRLNPIMGESWSKSLTGLYLSGTPIRTEAVNFEQRHVLCQAHTLSSDTDEQFVIFVITDISVLREYQRARDETLNFLSHDLRSPMVSILALIELSRERGIGGEGAAILNEIESYADKNLRFANNFLQYARVEASEALDCEPVDMHAVLGNAIDQVYRQAQAREIEIRTQFCDEDVWVSGQSDLLERAMINLLTNAIKFSDPGSCITVGLKTEQDRAVCSVADQGMGIAVEDIDNIFTRFGQVHGKVVGGRSGAGLGLRFVDLVVRRHQGDIAVSSEPGKGTLFTINLSLAAMEQG